MHDRPRIRALRASARLPGDGAGDRPAACSGEARALRARSAGWSRDEARATLGEAAPARRLEAAE